MRELTYTAAAREALAEEMAKDPTIFVVGEGIGPRGGNFATTAGLYDLYGPERLRDTPISERGFVGMCTGAAMTGSRPIVDFMFVDFLLDSLGELINQTAKIQLLPQGRGAARHLTERDLLRALAMYGAPGRLDRHRHPVPAAGSLAAGPELTPGRHP